jgi:hypothetical protein
MSDDNPGHFLQDSAQTRILSATYEIHGDLNAEVHKIREARVQKRGYQRDRDY